MKKQIIKYFSLLSLLLLVATGCANSNVQNNIPDDLNASLSVSDQKIKHESIVIDEVESSVDAWIVLYKAENHDAKKILGQKHITAGLYNDLEIIFDQNRTTEEELDNTKEIIVKLQYDNGKQNVFEPETVDSVIEIVPGMEVISSFEIL